MVTGAAQTLPVDVVAVMVMATVTLRVPAHLTVKAILMDAVVGMIVVTVMATVAVMATGNPIAQVMVMNIRTYELKIGGSGGTGSGQGTAAYNGSSTHFRSYSFNGEGYIQGEGYGSGEGSGQSNIDCQGFGDGANSMRGGTGDGMGFAK